MSKKQKYFCPMVYNALEIETTGAFSPCCITTKQYRNDDGEKFNVANDSISTVMASQDRKEFVENFDDYFESKCKHCFETEQGGGESKRLREIKYWKYHYNLEIHESLPTFTDDKLQVLDIKMGNTCNLACAMCGPDSSSKWASIFKGMGVESPKVEQWHDKDIFWDDLNAVTKDVTKIEIAGGEPFMIKKQIKLIEHLVENDLAKDIDILWITNCTFWPEKIISHFKEFKMVRIMLSLDNTGKQFEYIRYPAKWDETYGIFLKFKELSDQGIIELGISHSVGLLNAYHLPQFHQWARRNRVKVHNNLILGPIGARELPKSFKQVLLKRFAKTSDPKWQNNPIVGTDNWFVNYFMNDPTPESQYECDYWLNNVLIPSRPNLDFYEAFPELKGYVDV